jgi:asparagine synthase (glutamine-hydrolysing)
MRPPVLAAVPWIRPEARGELAALARAYAAREPRHWNRRIVYYTHRRQVRVTVRSLELLGAGRRVEVRHPLLAPPFLAALARHGGEAGYGDRTSAMRILFGDLLPPKLVVRRTKAEFGRALWKQAARAFATGWDGSGVDHELVDPQLVREAWRAPSPWFGANALLQQAWLAGDRR